MTRALAIVVSAALTGSLVAPPPVAAQSSNFGPSVVDRAPAQAAGWVFTPSMIYSTSWDDNVLVRGVGDQPATDSLNVLNPRVSLDFNGRRGQADLSYDGAFLRYREFDTLNSYDQHASFSARRLISPHVALFVRDSAALVPTTELVEFVGLPFVRTGSAIEDLRGGIEAALSRRTSVSASYNFQWVRFDESPDIAGLLRGGHSHGATLGLRHSLTDHTAIVADYDLQHAAIAGGAEIFDVQNGSIGIDQRLSESTHVFASAGIARLGVSTSGPARTGPAWRTGLVHQIRTAGIELLYSRSFVPSYGFGGTLQNEEATARLRVPLTHRLYTQSAVSWRSDEPLTVSDLNLRSLWIEAAVGYDWQSWLRVEGFYAGTHQTISRPGGDMDRNRVGFQIITTNPMRIR
jgi:hypothetical protein